MRTTAKRNVAFWASLLAAPVGIGLLARRRSPLVGAVAGGLTLLGLGTLRWQLARLFTEEPGYEIEQRIGPLEIRRYRPHVEARTFVDGDDFDAAVARGFRRLARYIFGANVKHDQIPSATAEPAHHEKLAMTAPVITEAEGDHAYSVAFVMPSGRSLVTLPTPIDDGVTLGEVPERRVAVLRFTGWRDAEHLLEHEDELLRRVRAAGLTAAGVPIFAGFDPPTTLPFLRRNEVWVELA